MMERRFLTTKVQLRMDSQGEAVLYGRAAAFNRLSSELPPGFRERLAPGCFTRALASPTKGDIYLAQDHDPSKILGRVRAGNLEVTQLDDGLYFNCTLPNTQLASDVRELVRQGILSECSFAFVVPDGGDDWADEDIDPEDLPDFNSRDGNGQLYGDRKKIRCTVRTVREVNPLLDVSIVANPAYGGGATNAYARNWFPEGIPVSVRSHTKDEAAEQSLARTKRRKLTDFILR